MNPLLSFLGVLDILVTAVMVSGILVLSAVVLIVIALWRN